MKGQHSCEAVASRDPYFAVLSSDRYRGSVLPPETRDEFFRTGSEQASAFLETINRHVSSTTQYHAALEYGCGPGRLAIPLSAKIERVTAVDSSPTMLALARQNAALYGATNIDFCAPEDLRGTPHSFDLVTCYLVLQRLPPDEGVLLIRELVDYIAENGVGIFHVPIQTSAGLARRSVRSVRTHIPGANLLLNLLQRKPLRTPSLRTYVYSIAEVMGALDGVPDLKIYTEVEGHGDLQTLLLFAHRAVPQPARSPSGELRTEDIVDVRRLIAGTNMEALNATAEEYFAGLSDWSHHLAKPFGSVTDAAPILISLGSLLQGMRLSPGQTVLDFGSGTGWLSRFLTQLGCRTILLDVSATALRMAQSLYERQPVFGEQPAPVFNLFDGRRIDLPDASVDRIISFDAFHHTINPEEVLREFSRVLRDGGIAGFSEPGPDHSIRPQSQFEMRTYGVVENDIDIQSIWNEARECGFAELRLAVFNVPPFHVAIEEYEDLLSGGYTLQRWAASTRSFLRDVRMFFLLKSGQASPDSRQAGGLACSIGIELAPPTPRAGEAIRGLARIANIGTAAWLPSGTDVGSVALGCHLYDGTGRLLRFDFAWADLTSPPRVIFPGESIETYFALPPLSEGEYVLEFDCVAERVSWFSQLGSPTHRHPVAVR